MDVFTAANVNQYAKARVLSIKTIMWISHDVYHVLTAPQFVRTQA
jgi:hypothetical protein